MSFFSTILQTLPTEPIQKQCDRYHVFSTYSEVFAVGDLPVVPLYEPALPRKLQAGLHRRPLHIHRQPHEGERTNLSAAGKLTYQSQRSLEIDEEILAQPGN